MKGLEMTRKGRQRHKKAGNHMEACQLVPHQVIIIRRLLRFRIPKWGAKTERNNLGDRRDDVSVGRD